MNPEILYTFSWQSPSNIALIKYWGKHGLQLPRNASLSMSLKYAFTQTRLRVLKKEKQGIDVRYYFEGRRNNEFEFRVTNFIQHLINEMPFLNQFALQFDSRNTFPHSAGIASSASSMSALALCLVEMEYQLKGVASLNDDFYKRASQIARLGSGSASRSIYGSWVTWGENAMLSNSSDEYATPLEIDINETFMHLNDAILLVDRSSKKVSSTFGHSLMDKHPYAESRYSQAADNLKSLLNAMQLGNFKRFSEVVENEALTLHGLLMTSSPDGVLIKPGTLSIIEAIRKYREKEDVKMCFTLDAGPNIHLLYPHNEREKVVSFINKELTKFCENGKWIDDQTGEGVVRLTR